MKILKKLIYPIIILIFAAAGGYLNNTNGKADVKFTPEHGYFYACFLDVGQGDCEFLFLPDGKTMIIDSGEEENFAAVNSFLKKHGVTSIDYGVATHPHSDHIGAMAKIIKKYKPKEFYMPDAVSATASYENMLDALKESGCKVKRAKAGEAIGGGEYSIKILSPVSGKYASLNDYSAVIKVTFGLNSVLYTGDAGKAVENQIMGENIKSDILKVGHHGSSTSSGKEFLRAVSPRYAVISAGKNNDYGHPHRETLKKLKNINAETLVTMNEGNIIFKIGSKKGEITRIK